MMTENADRVIRPPEVRAVFPDGSAEVMPYAVAVHKAQTMGLDLILIAPTAIPPVAKAVDYRQWLHENEQRRRGGV
jgi:translation initiation factor IF-3